MTRKTRLPKNYEELLDIPRLSDRWVPVPSSLKVSVCHLCGFWTIRRGGNSITDERAISGHLRRGSIRFRSFHSIGDRSVCEECYRAEIEMNLEEIFQAETVTVPTIQDKTVQGVANVA